MKILKDEPVSILTRVFGHGGRFYLAAAALLGFQLSPGGGLMREDELWSRAADSLGRQDALDLGMPKPQGEVLLAGFCFSPGGEPATAVTAGFRVGRIEKKLVVIGDRYWVDEKNSRHTPPRPFTSMPLSWERSFGGPDYGPNPCGCGMGSRQLKDGGKVYPLPNLEDPRYPVATPADRPPPAGFGPLGMSWPVRLQGLGAFDERWRREHWPGLPQDFDFSYFNVAPRDQRQEDFFRGDEAVSTLHLTGDEPRREARLPGLRARLFITRKGDAERNWLETKAELDTVWLFPHAGMGVLVWHGVWNTADDEGGDVREIMAVIEPLSAPPQEAAGHESRLKRQEEELPPGIKIPPMVPKAPPAPPGEMTLPAAGSGGKATAAATVAAAPAALAGTAAASEPPAAALPPKFAEYGPLTGTPPPGATDVEIVAFYEERSRKEQARLDEYLRSIGVAPDAPPPLADELPPALAKYGPLTGTPPPGATEEEIVAFYEDMSRKGQARFDEYLRSIGVAPDAAPPLAEQPDLPPAGEMIAALAALPGDNRELITALEEMRDEQRAVEAETEAMLAQAEVVAPDGGRLPPGGQETEQGRAPADPKAGFQEVAARLAAGRNLSEMDLTEVELRSFRLAGVDMSRANLEGVDLSGLDLSGSIFAGAFLAGAVMAKAALNGAVMTGANASRAKLGGADLRGADLTGMDLHNADLQGADLTGAKIAGADLSGANLARALGKDVRAEGALLVGADLTGADFTRAIFSDADLSESRLVGGIFSGADLRNVWFSDADASGANLQGATMIAAKAEGKTIFRSADLSGADLGNVYFEDADLTAANLTGADLTRASLTRCRLMDVNLARIRARQADFSKSDLTGANMRGMNLLEGSLHKARLTRADLRETNLFAVDLFKCDLGGARLEESNIKRTLLAGEAVNK